MTDDIKQEVGVWNQIQSTYRRTYSVSGNSSRKQIMKEEYEMPQEWYLDFEECDRDIVDNWRINIIKFSPNPAPGNTIDYKGRQIDNGKGYGYSQISIDQFKRYILNIQDPIINENYDYLIPLIEKL